LCIELWRLLSFVLGSKLLDLRAISEVVVQLGVDDSFHESACVVSQLDEYLYDDLHDDRAQRWEPHEHSVDDLCA
jgi:hypothetical protein